MYLIFDIGGTFIKYAWMKRTGELVGEGKFPTPYDSASDLVNKMVSVFRQQEQPIKGIAISCPGTIDIDSGVVYHGGSLTYLHEVNVKQLLEDACQVPVSIENDGKCAALAELWLGSVKDCKHAAVLVLGTGVGGGLIIDGKLHRGAKLEAGELSYVMAALDTETDEATFVGETGSASKMVNRIAELKGLEKNDGKAVFEYINQKDPNVLPIFSTYCKHIAYQILNLQYTMDPEVIAIGGGISVQPILLEGINQAIETIKKKNPLHVAKPNVVTCKFRSAANLYGAMYHYITQHENN